MQDNWQWCNKCSGLTFYGNGALGPCPAGGTHNHDRSGVYQLAGAAERPDGQNDWRWCRNCQGLFFVGNGSHGHCAAGGAHSDAGSRDYRLRSDGAGQNDWRWCRNCQGLWYAGDVQAGTDQPFTGRCPAPGHDGHVLVRSGDYVLDSSGSTHPAPITGMAVTGLFDDLLRISWNAYELDSARAEIHLYEGTGTYHDRFLQTLPITATEHIQDVSGDGAEGARHCFVLRVVDAFGYSAPTVACGTALSPVGP
jgi:hypothetical protein